MPESGVVRIDGAEVDYEVQRRRVRCPRLEFRGPRLFLVLPPGCDASEVLERHRRWISRHHARMTRAADDASVAKLERRGQEEFERLARWFVELYATELGVSVTKVAFREMRSKWGSCSSSGNISLNSRMRHLPERLIRYVAWHEVSHRVSLDHSGRFWDVVERRYVDVDEVEKELLTYWLALEKIYD
jgi:predicted metal-dependent hydrolase